jgi:ABC-2 type transport system ATP-binding protein
MLLDLVEPSAGNALVFGHHYRDLKRPATRIGAVLEAADFHPGRSGHHHLFALALGRDGVEGNWFLARERAARRRVERLLKMVELTGASRRRVGGYSLGMRQRLGLAAVLLGDPDLLIRTSRPTVSTRGGALATRLPTVFRGGTPSSSRAIFS